MTVQCHGYSAEPQAIGCGRKPSHCVPTWPGGDIPKQPRVLCPLCPGPNCSFCFCILLQWTVLISRALPASQHTKGGEQCDALKVLVKARYLQLPLPSPKAQRPSEVLIRPEAGVQKGESGPPHTSRVHWLGSPPHFQISRISQPGISPLQTPTTSLIAMKIHRP